jgi:hypothetical protein
VRTGRHRRTSFGAPQAAPTLSAPRRARRIVGGGRRLVRLGLLVLVPLLLAGCTSRTPASISGEWRGAYTCSGVLIGLTLEIGEPLGDHVPATFASYALPSNPDGPDGRFWMGGSFVGNDRLVFTAGGWLDRPDGADLLDLDGTLSADRRTYSGLVVGSADCTGFFVSRGD